MSVLERARKAYVRVQTERNGHVRNKSSPPEWLAQPPKPIDPPPVEPATWFDTGCEKSELSEISPGGVPSGGASLRTDHGSEFLPVSTPDLLPTVLQALDETDVVGLDVETTGLNPR